MKLAELKGARLHFVGIGGSGMSGLARIALAMGIETVGSDAKDSQTLKDLEGMGAEIFRGHDRNNVVSNSVLVVSSAIPNNNPELERARELNLPIITRAQALALFMDGKKSIAVAGTHGKTTTTSMLTVALQSLGLNPSFAIGGTINRGGTNAHFGGGEYFVAEADESDGSFLHLSPKIVVVTNVEPDHLDYWKTFEKIEEAFLEFSSSTKLRNGFAVICNDDNGAKKLIANAKLSGVNVITYGISDGSDLKISNLKLGIPGPTFNVNFRGRDLGEMTLKVLGTHNALNASAALAVGLELGFDFAQLKNGIANFSGTRRRFEYRGMANNIRVYDDYAHHPTEITATLKAARDVVAGGKIVVAFQAHHYYRTALFNKEFGQALALADEVVVLEVFAPGEEAIPGASGQTMASLVPLPKNQVIFEPSWSKVAQHLVDRAKPNDIIMTLGAGDIGLLAPEVLNLLESKSKS